MGFSSDFIIQVKSSSSLEDIAAETIVLKKRSSKSIGLCPFHADKNPSLEIKSERYKCWTCGEEGDVVQWMVKLHHNSFTEAIRFLAQRAGIPIPLASITPEVSAVRKRQRQLLHKAQSLYVSGLMRSQSASQSCVTYLHDRGITDDSIRQWGLGLVSSGICRFLDAQETDLIEIGIIGKSEDDRCFERLRQRLTIPIRSQTGGLIGFAGRRLNDVIPLGPKYLNPPATTFFDKKNVLFGLDKSLAEIRKSNIVIVAEGYFDVIALHQAGERRAVAGMGTALTAEQLTRLFSLSSTVIFCFDGDKAGHRAISRILPKILNHISDGKTCRFLFLPNGHDPDEFIRHQGKNAWDIAVAKAEPLSQLLLRYITKNKAQLTVEERVTAAMRAEKICLAIKHAPYYRQILRHEIEQRYGIKMELNDE
jgi:DNA primase